LGLLTAKEKLFLPLILLLLLSTALPILPVAAMVDKGNQKWGDLLLQIAAGILASSSTVWPVKAQTVPLFPIEELNERPDFVTQTRTETQNPNLSEPLVPQTVPSGPNLPQPANPSPSLQERKTEPNPDSSQLYECPLPVRSPEPQSPLTQTPKIAILMK
jgi:hypothetical protein